MNSLLRGGFRKKQMETKTLGERLRRAREHFGLELNEVAEKTKIQVKYLKALEESDYANLPPDVYVRGFLRDLCDMYVLPYNKVVSAYEKEHGIDENLKKKNLPLAARTPIKNPRFVITPRILTIAIIAAAVVGALVYLGYQISSFSRPPQLSVTNPAQDQSVTTTSVVVSGKTDPESKVTINSQPVFVDQEGNFQESISLQTGVNILHISSINKLNKENVITRQIVVNTPAVTTPPPADQTQQSTDQAQQQPAQTTGVNLVIKIGPQASYINVEVDGETAQDGTMLAGTTKTFTGTSRIVLTTGNGGSTSVTFNGQDFGKVGEDGAVVRNIEFTPGLSVLPTK